MSLMSTPITSDLVRGALDLEPTEHGLLPHRLPAWAREQIPDGQLAMMEAQPSGVRLVFRTAATAIELDALPTKLAYPGAPPRPDGVYDLLVDGRLAGQATASGGNVRTIDLTTGGSEITPGPVATIRFDGLTDGAKDVEVWLPHNETTELVRLRSDAPLAPTAESGRRVWLHHGSSISHGSNAESPTTTWPALAAAAGGVELVNLGFGGSALLDPIVARVMRDTPADLVSVKLGINLVNVDLMSLAEFAPAVDAFLDIIREGHPATPLLVVSSVLAPIHEHTPGPAVPDLTDFAAGRLSFRASGDPSDPTRLTLTSIRAELARLCEERAATDPHLHHLDGRELYGEADAERLPLPDQLHPDPATHRLIGQRFAQKVFGEGGAFTV